MRNLKVIFFDAMGTLIHLPRGVGFHYAEVAQRFGWKAEAESLGRIFREVWKDMPPRQSTRAPRADDDRGWWRELVMQVLLRSGVPDGFDRDGYFEAVYREFTRPGVWTLFPEAREILDLLAARHRLAILSNFDSRLRTVLAGLGVADRFAHLVISSEVGADKPDPWIFAHALALTGAAPHEALLIGDDLRCDIEGARHAGWHTFHLDRPHTTLHDLAHTLNAPLPALSPEPASPPQNCAAPWKYPHPQARD